MTVKTEGDIYRREADVWGAFRKHLPPGTMVRRIEDASGNLGTWDTFLARGGRCAWLEFKLAGPRAKPTLRRGQRAFGLELVDAGVPAAYVVGSPNGSIRVLDPRTDGADWVLCQIATYDDLNVWTVKDMLGLIRFLPGENEGNQ